jgi:hypothetical protein
LELALKFDTGLKHQLNFSPKKRILQSRGRHIGWSNERGLHMTQSDKEPHLSGTITSLPETEPAMIKWYVEHGFNPAGGLIWGTHHRSEDDEEDERGLEEYLSLADQYVAAHISARGPMKNHITNTAKRFEVRYAVMRTAVWLSKLTPYAREICLKNEVNVTVAAAIGRYPSGVHELIASAFVRGVISSSHVTQFLLNGRGTMRNRAEAVGLQWPDGLNSQGGPMLRRH